MAVLLIADPDPEVALAFKAAAGEGVDVEVTEDGKLAVEMAINLQPDLVVLSAELPKGLLWCGKLRKNSATAHTPILLVYAAGNARAIAKHKKLPVRANAYIEKPLDAERARAAMEEHAPGVLQAAPGPQGEATADQETEWTDALDRVRADLSQAGAPARPFVEGIQSATSVQAALEARVKELEQSLARARTQEEGTRAIGKARGIKLQSLREDLAKANTRIVELEEQLKAPGDETRFRLDEALKKLAAMTAERDEAQRRSHSVATERVMLQEKLEGSDGSADSLAAECEELQGRLEESRGRMIELAGINDEIKAELQQARARAELAEVESDNLRALMEQLSSDEKAPDSEQEDLTGRVEDLGREAAEAATERDRLSGDLEETQARLEVVLSERDALRAMVAKNGGATAARPGM